MRPPSNYSIIKEPRVSSTDNQAPTDYSIHRHSAVPDYEPEPELENYSAKPRRSEASKSHISRLKDPLKDEPKDPPRPKSQSIQLRDPQKSHVSRSKGGSKSVGDARSLVDHLSAVSGANTRHDSMRPTREDRPRHSEVSAMNRERRPAHYSSGNRRSKSVGGRASIGRRIQRPYHSPLKRLYESDYRHQSQDKGMFETQYNRHFKDWIGDAVRSGRPWNGTFVQCATCVLLL